MTAFATYSDLQARLGVTFDSGEQTRAGLLLTMASDLIREHVGQTIDHVASNTLTIPGHPGDRIRLPQRPVGTVASVTLDDTTLDPDSWYVDGDELVRLFATSNQFTAQGGGWGRPFQTLVITYASGYSTIPTICKVVAVESAARAWNNPEGATTAVLAGTQFSFADVGLMLTEDEEEDLSRKLRRTAGSLRLR